MVTVQTLIGVLLALIITQRLSELRLAKRNEAWARAQGAQEYGQAHYPLFFVLHSAWLIAWPLEAWSQGTELSAWWWVAGICFLAAQGLRYWAIGSLKERWNTRILVFEEKKLVVKGPYRFLRHPNYVAVALEIVSVPLMLGAWWSAGIFTVLNAMLLLGVRIPAEERALKLQARRRIGGIIGRGT